MFQRLPFRLTVTTNAIFPRRSSPYSDHCFTKSCLMTEQYPNFVYSKLGFFFSCDAAAQRGPGPSHSRGF